MSQIQWIFSMQQSVFNLSHALLALAIFVFSTNVANAQSTFGFCATPSAEEFNAKAPPSSSQSRISKIANTFRRLSSAPRVRNTAFAEAQARANRGSIQITVGDLLTSVGEGASVYNQSRPTPSQPRSSGGTGDCKCESGDLSDCSYELSGIQKPYCHIY